MAKPEEIKKDVVGGAPETKSDKIEVSKDTLAQILAKQEEQEATIKRLTKDNEKLLSVSDKSRLAHYESTHGSAELIRKANLGVWEGQIVLCWKRKEDKVWFENGVLRERQIITLFIENAGKEPKEVDQDYLFFYQNMQRQAGDIIKQSKGVGGVETYTLKLEDGREFEVDVKFINP